MNNAFSLLRTLQVGGLFCGVPKIYDRDCSAQVLPPNNVVEQNGGRSIGDPVGHVFSSKNAINMRKEIKHCRNRK